MIENEERENQLSQAARKVACMARETAIAAGVTLIGLKWHRGHEVADLDDYWLTLESEKRVVTEHIPNEWLEALGKSTNDGRIAQRLFDMVQALDSGATT